MDLDPAILIPALFFTVVAVVFASKFFNQKEVVAPKKKQQVGYADVIPPSRALGVVVQPKVEVPPAPVIAHKEVEVKAEEVIPAPKEEQPITVAPVVEEIGVVEETPLIEAEIIPEVKVIL